MSRMHFYPHRHKFNYLACEVCGSLRVEDTDNTEGAFEDDDRSRKRKAF